MVLSNLNWYTCNYSLGVYGIDMIIFVFVAADVNIITANPVQHLVETSLSNTNNSSPVPNPDELVGGGEEVLGTEQELAFNEVYIQLQDELREDLIDLLEDQDIEQDPLVIEPDQIQSANESHYSPSPEFELDLRRIESGSQVEQDNQVTQGQAERVKAQLRHLIEMVELEGQYQQNGQASDAGQSSRALPPPVLHLDVEQHQQGGLQAVQPSGEQDGPEQDHVHKPADETEEGEAGLGAEQVAAQKCEVVQDLDQAESEEAMMLVGSNGDQIDGFQLSQAEGQVGAMELTHQLVTEPVNANQIVTDPNQIMMDLENANQVASEPVNENLIAMAETEHEQSNQKQTPESNRKAADSSVVDYQNALPMRKAQHVTEEPSFSSELSFQLPIGHRRPSISRIENHTLSPGMASGSGVMWAAHTSPPPSFPPPPPPPPPRDNGEPLYMWNGPVDGLASPQSPQANQCLVPDAQAGDNNNAYYQSYYTLFVPTPYYTYAVIPK